MNFFKYLICLSAIVVLFSCNDSDDDEGFGIEISPEANRLNREGGSVVNFVVSIQSTEDLRRYRVSENIDNGGFNLLKEADISGKFYSDFFDYTVPDTFDFGLHEIVIKFSTLDVRGNLMERAKVINVNITERTLTEYGGNTMYSNLSSQPDAFDLLNGSSKYSSDTLAHIRDFTLANPNDSLGKAWTSPMPGISFVRIGSGGFDYGNATDQNVMTSYEAGVKNDTIRNLKAEDVILTKINDTYVAVKLVLVIDEAGTTNDRYFFSIKR